MQQRHTERLQYFNEQAGTSQEYYMDYLRPFTSFHGARILEIGCGEGGNLKPFAESGCEVTGIEMDATRVAQARTFFAQAGLRATFVCQDFLQMETPADDSGCFDIILLHDVIEHIMPAQKHAFLKHIRQFLRPSGVLFVGFPAWQNPFGGHQQISVGMASKLPFIHLLPRPVYRWLLRMSGSSAAMVSELMDIRTSRMTIESFQRLALASGFVVKQRTLWLINPHYKQKFGLRPRRLWRPFASLPYVRNVYTTSAFYLLSASQA